MIGDRDEISDKRRNQAGIKIKLFQRNIQVGEYLLCPNNFGNNQL